MIGNLINVNKFYWMYYFYLYLEIWYDFSLFVMYGNVSFLINY